MKPKTIYLALCFVGGLLPFWQLVAWAMQHGFNLSLFVRELFATRIGGFFGMEVLVSAIVFRVFMRVENSRISVPRRWLPVLAVLLVGVSHGLPLFLYMRELRLEEIPATQVVR
jgi:Terpene cyclase DEP1